MSFFKNNKAVIVLGGSALALTAGVVIYLNSKKQQKQEAKEEKQLVNEAAENSDENRVKRGAKHSSNQEQVIVQVDQDQEQKQFLQEKEQDFSVKTKTSIASSRVKVQFLNGTDNFDFATIAAILESSLDYIGEEYISYTQKNREGSFIVTQKKRRKTRNLDMDRYKELVLEYNAQVEKFILTAQDQLLTDINIDKEIYEKSIEILIQSGYYQQLYMVQSAMRQKISEKLPRKNQVSKDKIKEIIQYQLEILNNQKDPFIAIISQLQYLPDIAELIPFVLNTMISDMIFEKFGVEEEDQATQMSAQDVIEDPVIHGLLKQIEESMLNMMQQLGLNYFDEEQELEEIERLREQGQYSEN